MTFVVGSPCVGCKDTECITVCPVDCFYEGDNMLVIDPDECIDCALCEPACPVDAIWSDDELPDDQIPFIAINADKAQEYTNITDDKPAMGEAWSGTVQEAIDLILAE